MKADAKISTMQLKDLISSSNRGYPVYPVLIRAFGLESAILLSRAIWFQEKDGDWIECSIADMEAQTGLAEDRQRRARGRLVDVGVLEVNYSRLQHKLKLRIKKDALEKEIDSFANPQNAGCNEPVKGKFPNPQNAGSIKDKDTIPKTKTSIAEPAASAPSEHKQFVTRWSEEFEALFGEPYPFGGAKDGAAVKRLLSKSRRSVEELIEVATKAWDKKHLFNCTHSVTIAGFVSRFIPICVELKILGEKKNEKSANDHAW